MSYSVIIADDEPLVLIGLKSLINWQSHNFEIVATARNGKELEEAILLYNPELVITDIKMPIKSGLEILEEENAKHKILPLFILLTSFEEFEYVKRAIKNNAIDYLVKLELDEKNLISALEKAKDRIETLTIKHNEANVKGTDLKALQEKFFIRQFFLLGENETPLSEQIKALNLNLDYAYFSVAYITIPAIRNIQDKQQALKLYYSTISILLETVSHHFPIYIVSLDFSHIAIVFCVNEKDKYSFGNSAIFALKNARENAQSFFSAPFYAAIGPLVSNIRFISESFSKAKLLSNKNSDTLSIEYCAHIQNQDYKAYDTVNFAFYSKSLNKAFEELDFDTLHTILSAIVDTIESKNVSRIEALDIASNILYMVSSLIIDGQDLVEKIFQEYDGQDYRILYQLRNAKEIAHWINTLNTGLNNEFINKKQDYRQQIVIKIQGYLNENIEKKLTLSETADLFGYSQGYLSSLFSKYAKTSFIDYITHLKIQRAKEMLLDTNAKVYEVADSLSFESSFYFSKVFKKITGISPTDYQNTKRGTL